MKFSRIKDHEHCCDLCLVVPVQAGRLCENCGRLPNWKWWLKVYLQDLHLWWLGLKHRSKFGK